MKTKALKKEITAIYDASPRDVMEWMITDLKLVYKVGINFCNKMETAFSLHAQEQLIAILKLFFHLRYQYIKNTPYDYNNNQLPTNKICKTIATSIARLPQDDSSLYLTPEMHTLPQQEAFKLYHAYGELILNEKIFSKVVNIFMLLESLNSDEHEISPSLEVREESAAIPPRTPRTKRFIERVSTFSMITQGAEYTPISASSRKIVKLGSNLNKFFSIIFENFIDTKILSDVESSVRETFYDLLIDTMSDCIILPFMHVMHLHPKNFATLLNKLKETILRDTNHLTSTLFRISKVDPLIATSAQFSLIHALADELNLMIKNGESLRRLLTPLLSEKLKMAILDKLDLISTLKNAPEIAMVLSTLDDEKNKQHVLRLFGKTLEQRAQNIDDIYSLFKELSNEKSKLLVMNFIRESLKTMFPTFGQFVEILLEFTNNANKIKLMEMAAFTMDDIADSIHSARSLGEAFAALPEEYILNYLNSHSIQPYIPDIRSLKDAVYHASDVKKQCLLIFAVSDIGQYIHSEGDLIYLLAEEDLELLYAFDEVIKKHIQNNKQLAAFAQRLQHPPELKPLSIFTAILLDIDSAWLEKIISTNEREPGTPKPEASGSEPIMLKPTRERHANLKFFKATYDIGCFQQSILLFLEDYIALKTGASSSLTEAQHLVNYITSQLLGEWRLLTTDACYQEIFETLTVRNDMKDKGPLAGILAKIYVEAYGRPVKEYVANCRIQAKTPASPIASPPSGRAGFEETFQAIKSK